MIDLKAAAARSAGPDPVRELTFKELCATYFAVELDGADLRVKNGLRHSARLSAWKLARAMLERCMEAMAGRLQGQHHQPRHQPDRLGLQMGRGSA